MAHLPTLLPKAPAREGVTDGLRGMGALLVFMVHFHALFGPLAVQGAWVYLASEFAAGVGRTGVGLFWTLSGYLIYRGLLERRTPYVSFLKRRIQRIYPTFFAVFILYLFLSALFPSENKIHGTVPQIIKLVAANLALVPPFFSVTPIIAVSWTLSFTVLFYLLVPISVWVFNKWELNAHRRLACLVTIWVLYATACVFTGWFARSLQFITGMIFAELINADILKRQRSRARELACAATAASCFVYAYLFHVCRIPLWAPFRPYVFRQVVVALGFLLLFTCALRFDGWVARVLSWPSMRWIGRVSFSWYLIHGAVLNGILRLLDYGPAMSPCALPLVLAVAVGATAVASAALYKYVEAPLSFPGRNLGAAPARQRGTLSFPAGFGRKFGVVRQLRASTIAK